MSTANKVTAAIIAACVVAVWFATRLGEQPAPVPPPEPAPVVVCERWQDTLASRIGKSITMSDELTLVLVELHKAGDVTDSELRAVQDVLPDLTLKDRALTAADAEKIRGVK
jgi:hypothetical protein